MADSVHAVPVLVNGQEIFQGYLVNGATLGPVREVAEALGATVTYDPQKGVNITPKG